MNWTLALPGRPCHSALIKLDQVSLQNFKLIHHSLFWSLPFGLLFPLLFRVLCSRRARGKMENGKIQDFRKCGDKLCGGWLGGPFYSTLSFLIGSCRSQTLHFMRARGGRGTPPHNQQQEERRQPRGNENTTWTGTWITDWEWLENTNGLTNTCVIIALSALSQNLHCPVLDMTFR